jgi:hypothetical protein
MERRVVESDLAIRPPAKRGETRERRFRASFDQSY